MLAEPTACKRNGVSTVVRDAPGFDAALAARPGKDGSFASWQPDGTVRWFGDAGRTALLRGETHQQHDGRDDHEC